MRMDMGRLPVTYTPRPASVRGPACPHQSLQMTMCRPAISDTVSTRHKPLQSATSALADLSALALPMRPHQLLPLLFAE